MTEDKELNTAATWWGGEVEDGGGDDRIQEALRPATLDEFSGQPAVSRELSIILGSAKARHTLCDHLLFSGPPGLGKTTLAGIVAQELGLNMVMASGTAIEKPGDMAGILTNLKDGSLLFIDELHRLPKVCEEVLYTAMEDRRIDIVVGERSSARTIPLPLAEFVLVGATTQSGQISAPLRDRFGFSARLRLYDDDALTGIVIRSSRLLGFDEDTFTPEAAAMVASRSRGTPRVANKWLRRVRDFALLERYTIVDGAAAQAALEAFGVDELGLDALGRDILRALCESFGGGPVGVSTLAAAVGESTSTLEEVYEPYLMARRLLGRTPRGRIATEAAWAHLGLVVPASALLEESENMIQGSLLE